MIKEITFYALVCDTDILASWLALSLPIPKDKQEKVGF